MRRWQLALLGLSVAALAGWIGHWSGSISPASFAQESKRDASKQTESAAGPDQGWIGLMVAGKTEGQPVVANVFPGGPSAFAGIRQGDVLLQVGGTKIQSEPQLAQAIEQTKPGTEVAVNVKRGEKELSLKVRVGSLREFHKHYAREMWRRDPRDPNYAQSHGVSQADLQVELVRRLFEQNERLERSLLDLHKEVAALRNELKGKK